MAVVNSAAMATMSATTERSAKIFMIHFNIHGSRCNAELGLEPVKGGYAAE